MVEIFNDLAVFFNDNYRRINVREYARIRGISPPTAAKLLASYEKEGLLIREVDRKFMYFSANKDSKLFIDLSRAFWTLQLKNEGIIAAIQEACVTPTIILFGSLSKAEVTPTSDIDIAVITPSKKAITTESFRKRFGREVHIFMFPSKEKIDKRLLSSIMNGHALCGGW